MCKYKHSAICMQYENCKSAISEIWKYLKNFQSCHFLIKTLEILSSKGKPHGIKMVKLKDAGDQNLDKFDKLTTYVYYFGEGKDSSVCGNCWGITHTRHTHTHTHTQAFPSLPTACLQPPSCQHDPSAPPQNQTLLIETWWQSGRCGSHVSYWWFMSSYKAASLIKRSHRPAHRPSHTPKVLVKHISFLLNVVFVKLQRVPTGTGRHVKNPEMSLQRETLWFHGAVVIMGGVSGHVCGCVLVCAEDFRAATQPEFLALFPTITRKLCPKFWPPLLFYPLASLSALNLPIISLKCQQSTRHAEM